MAQTFSVQVDRAQLARLNTTLMGVSKDANIALARAINKTLGKKGGGVRRDVSVEIRKTHNLTQKYIYKQGGKRSERTFDVTKATWSKPSGKLRIQSANVPLIQYSNARNTTKKKTLSIKVLKSRKSIRPRHMFVAKMKTGHVGVFERKNPDAKGKNARKIVQKYGSRIPDTLIRSDTGIMRKIQVRAQKRLNKYLAHEVDFILMKRKN